MSTERPDPVLTSPADPPASPSAPSRRTFIATSTAIGGTVVAGGLVAGPLTSAAEEAVAAEAPPGSRVSLTVNGVRHTVTVDNSPGLIHHRPLPFRRPLSAAEVSDRTVEPCDDSRMFVTVTLGRLPCTGSHTRSCLCQAPHPVPWRSVVLTSTGGVTRFFP
ncbi:twin-arginine translocation signal domain-containing protein [Streptomyces sp. NBC_00286]|uniref:twin-arginine translocation signal domain-containing protein n=1 Tax=Streptomyces sp. NBC_00286 TaxID=2975701 RepID=UPI002E27D467|nr:twin-arginine translocation signal domain-containing protein [Streptomyces sp. NBC_00286]